MDRNGGDQGPIGSDTGNDQPTTDAPDELAAKEASDPNQTGSGEPESGAGYGNHAPEANGATGR